MELGFILLLLTNMLPLAADARSAAGPRSKANISETSRNNLNDPVKGSKAMGRGNPNSIVVKSSSSDGNSGSGGIGRSISRQSNEGSDTGEQSHGSSGLAQFGRPKVASDNLNKPTNHPMLKGSGLRPSIGRTNSLSNGLLSTYSSMFTYDVPKITFGGRSVIPYRSIRPIDGASYDVPMIFSPVDNRPAFISEQAYWPTYPSNSRYKAYKQRYYARKLTNPLHTIFTNYADHCAFTEYGIDGHEEYFITSIKEDVPETAAGAFRAAYTPSCKIDIIGPDDSLLHVTFNTTTCNAWPKNCEIMISESLYSDESWDDIIFYDPTLMKLDSQSIFDELNSASGQSSCSKEFYSRTNKLYINVAHCAANLQSFEYYIAIEVSVLLDDALSAYKPYSWRLLTSVCMSFLLAR